MGWLIAGWFLLLFTAVTIWHNIGWSRMQRRVAQQRSSLGRQAYVDQFTISDASPDVSGAIYDALQPCCVNGVAPHPDDGLVGFYFDDPEDMEDLIEELFVKLSLPMPTRYEPEITPHLQSARELGGYLQTKLEALKISPE